MNKKQQNKYSRGFTIIEMIVVLSIIAILASLIIINVSKYQEDSRITAIKENLNNLAKSAFLYSIDNGNYNGFCESPMNVNPFFNAIAKLTGADTFLGNMACSVGTGIPNPTNPPTSDPPDSHWCACAPTQNTGIIIKNTNVYCVDDTGYKLERNNTSCLAVCQPIGKCL